MLEERPDASNYIARALCLFACTFQGLLRLIQSVVRRFLELHHRCPENVKLRVAGPTNDHVVQLSKRGIVVLAADQLLHFCQLLYQRAAIVHVCRPLPFSRSRTDCSISFFIWRAFLSGGDPAANCLISP